jgi:tripartite-type tricarboxylate transporter receptor subunit TctC
MHTKRRHALALLASTLLPVPAFANADGIPKRPVKIIFPFTPGGTGDPVARGIAEGLSKKWGVPVIVENRPGAGGMIGTSAVAKAEPDGTTLLVTITAVIQSPLLFNAPPYDPIIDLAPVSRVATFHSALTVSKQFPANTLHELVAYAKQQGKLAYGTVGNGSGSHLQMERLSKEMGMSVEHVAYKGEAQLITDLIGGQIGVGFLSAISASKFKDSIRALAVTGTYRSPLLPDTPTLVETGSRAMETMGWFGLFAPAKTLPTMLERISLDLREVLGDSKLRMQLADMGVLVSPSTPAEFASQVKRDQKYWSEITQAAGSPKQ